jgi:hypothetical protein
METAPTSFAEIALYLTHPLALAGFALMLVVGVHRALIASGIISPLSQRSSGAVIRLIVHYGFLLALVSIVLGFALQYFEEHPASSLTSEPAAPFSDEHPDLSGARVAISGNVTRSPIVTGNHNNVTFENIEGISPEQFQKLAERLGVTEAALERFFEILERSEVPHSGKELDRVLGEIATRYKELNEKEQEAVRSGNLRYTSELVGLVSQVRRMPEDNAGQRLNGRLRLNVTRDGEPHIPRGLNEAQ